MNRRPTHAEAAACIAAEPAPFGPIAIARGVGQGPTQLAAFDTALLDAGVANYNLICLSSVIPPGSVIERRRWTTPSQHWGQRLHSALETMQRHRGVSLGPVHTEIASACCEDAPVCALVIAVYASQPW